MLQQGPDPRRFEYRSIMIRRVLSVVTLALLVALVIASIQTTGDTLAVPVLGREIDELWVLLSASLVFFMQAGFLMFEVGLARSAHAGSVAVKNLIDWTVGSLAFSLIGFSLMFGVSNGYFGEGLVALRGLFAIDGGTVSGPTFFLFQLAFAGTAITIVSGSLVERTTFLAYVAFAAVVGLVIYPVYGHWVWGGQLGGDAGWLAANGFRDFAGGTVVHTTGAWAALIGVIFVGPRIGRFGPSGSVRVFESSSIPMTALGTLILWFGWFGFNGGSTLALTADVPRIILVTNLSGVGGLVGAAVFAYLIEDRIDLIGKMIGGAVSGLVAITPGADVIGLSGSLAIGLVAGVIYALGYELLLRFRIDDALGVVPAHGFAGAWGTVALAIFAPASALGRSNFEQFGIQVVGVLVNLAWVGSLSIVVFAVLRSVIGLRVSPARELDGVHLEADDLSVPIPMQQEQLSDDELARLLD
ncbi:MAG: ammonium transporter [Actinomycetota bacterium]